MNKIKRKVSDDPSILTQRNGGEKVVFAVVFVLLGIYCLSVLLPFVWLLINSFQESITYAMNILDGKVFALPEKWLIKNYLDAFVELSYKNTNFLGMFWNTIWMVTVTSVLSVFTHSVTGYIFAKYNFRAKPIMYFLAIFSMTVPIVGATASQYKINIALGLYNNPLGRVVAGTSGFGADFLIMYAIFEGVPQSYAEAVFIDGGNDFTVFFKIMIPQALPAMLTLLVTAIIVHWKEYENILMFYPDYPTLTTGLYRIKTMLVRTGGHTKYFAGMVLATIPVIGLYALSSNSMMKNLSVGGLKG